MRMSRRLISTSTGASSSNSAGVPPRAEAKSSIRSWRPRERVDGQPGPRQQPSQLVDPPELARGVEAPVQDAVAPFQIGQQASEGLGRRLRLRGQALRLGLLQILSQSSKARRVLAHQQLRREVQGVERPGEGPQLRLVQLQAHHLAHAQLHPVQGVPARPRPGATA